MRDRQPDTSTSDETLISLTAMQAVTAIRRGEITAERYVTALVARAERLRDLNVCIALNRNTVLEDAARVDLERKDGRPLGPLAGLPLLIKDNIDTQVLPTTAGCRGLAGNRPRRDAPVLKRLLDGGALVMAKANMHELALGITSTNAAYGAVRNPYDHRMIAGGSSGGTAAGIAGRLAPAGLGTDTGGSLRIPAALCGIVALRPSVGNGAKRYSTAGVVPISHTRDTIGPMARTVEDVALLDSVVTTRSMPNPVALEGLRLGVPRRYFWDALDSELGQVAESALARLKAAGAVLVDVDLAPVRDLNATLDLPIGLYELGFDLRAYLSAAEAGTTFEDVVTGVASKDVARVLTVASMIEKQTYEHAIHVLRPQLQKLYLDCFMQHDLAAVVFPTTPLPARPLNENGDSGEDTVELNGSYAPAFPTYTRNTSPASNAGLPGLSLPIGTTRAGLPIGIEIDGPVNSDRTLLGIAMSFEDEFGTLPPPNLPAARGKAPGEHQNTAFDHLSALAQADEETAYNSLDSNASLCITGLDAGPVDAGSDVRRGSSSRTSPAGSTARRCRRDSRQLRRGAHRHLHAARSARADGWHAGARREDLDDATAARDRAPVRTATVRPQPGPPRRAPLRRLRQRHPRTEWHCHSSAR